MSLNMKIHREVELQIDQMYKDTRALGSVAFQVFGRDRGKAQLRNLENIANSTLKVSDVLDYIKRQTARMNEWKKQGFGKRMLKYVEEDIDTQKKDIFDNLAHCTILTQSETDDLQSHQVEFMKQNVAMQLIRHFPKNNVPNARYRSC